MKTRTDFIKTVDDLSAELNGKLILILIGHFCWITSRLKRNGIEKNYGMLGVGLKKSIPLSDVCVCVLKRPFLNGAGVPIRAPSGNSSAGKNEPGGIISMLT